MSGRLALVLFSLCGLAATVSSRSVDPLVSILAADFSVPTTSAALVSSFYALPFALGQPVLGPMGDAFGKTRMLRCYLWVLAACLLGSAFAPSLHVLLILRFCSGFVGGGIIPACMASLGDRFAGPERTIAISRFVTVGLMAQILSASLSGVIASILGWRSVFIVAGCIATTSALAATFFLEAPATAAKPFSFRTAVRNYRSVFANPKAPLCFGTVFLEGIALFGITPYIAALLRTGHMGDAREAGIVIGAMGVGGIVYSFVLPMLLRRVSKYSLLGAGGVIAATGPLTLAFASSWLPIVGAFAVTGFGYMLMHNSIQSEAVELAPNSRVSAYSMHAFSFFIGQSLGPIAAGLVLTRFGSTGMLMTSAAILAATGPSMARRFVRLGKSR
jgi:predicted MFS family arabinose efflux permease